MGFMGALKGLGGAIGGALGKAPGAGAISGAVNKVPGMSKVGGALGVAPKKPFGQTSNIASKDFAAKPGLGQIASRSARGGGGLKPALSAAPGLSAGVAAEAPGKPMSKPRSFGAGRSMRGGRR